MSEAATGEEASHRLTDELRAAIELMYGENGSPSLDMARLDTPVMWMDGEPLDVIVERRNK